MTKQVSLRAFAKVNLGLRVLYKRPDGYHELRTVFQTISLADRLGIEFTPSATTTIQINGTPEIPDNLVERAARSVIQELSIEADIVFELKKNIPSGAGLGGGSSDAAAVLLALPILAGRAIPLNRLLELAAKLGSDVPFFLYGGTALGLGRGEELYPLADSPKSKLLLLAPNVHSSTADAYRDLSVTLTTTGLQNKLTSFQQNLWCGGEQGGAIDGNDFEDVVFRRHPELAGFRDALLHLGASEAMMTGSGSAIFARFRDQKLLDKAAESFKKERVYKISPVGRSQYRNYFRKALRNYIDQSPNLWPPQSPHAR